MKPKPSILLVDDKEENLTALETVLADLDVEFVRAGSGNEALKKTLEHSFAIALIDVQMPEMDGFETVQYLREASHTRDLPVIFLSAIYKEDYYQIKGICSGAVDFITKPIVPEILVGKVRIFLELYEKQRAMEAEIDRRRAAEADLKRSEAELKRINGKLSENLRALSASEERFRTLVLTIPDIVYHIDRDGRFTYLNQAVTQIGYDPQELLGKHFTEILVPPDRDVASREKVLPEYAGKTTGDAGAPKLFDERRTGDRKTTGLELRLAVKDGNESRTGSLLSAAGDPVTVEINSSGLWESTARAEEKRFVGTVGVIRDITERKAIEAALQATIEDMERKVEERTLDLKQSQAKLINTEKIAALGTLTAGIAHELNNPMMGMLNFAQYCQKHIDDDHKVFPVLEDLERETRRCTKIIRNLLTFSRAEAETREKRAPVRPADLFERVRKLLSYRMEKEGITFSLETEKDCPEVMADANGLQQAFLNLIGNALDAMAESREKEITVHITTDEEVMHIRVADTGSGIPPEKAPDIFDPFFTTKPVGKGTGLGLSVTRSIVERHGGAITCSSDGKKGAVFAIELPLTLCKTEERTDRSSVESENVSAY